MTPTVLISMLLSFGVNYDNKPPLKQAARRKIGL
jgi:hypothetical protein